MEKSNLGIAYSMKRRNAKKMAKGGAVDNEDLNPMHEAPHIAENAVLKQMDYGFKAQQHEDLLHPVQPSRHVSPKEENLPAHMFARGGIAQAIMKKRMMAEGGPVDAMGLQDQEYDQDRFLSEFMEPQHYGHITALDESDAAEDADPKLKRKNMIGKIMSELHSKHMGK